MPQNIQLERRRINDDIETSYLDTVRAARDVLVALSTDKGSHYNKYTAFTSEFILLVSHTSRLKEMREDPEVAKICDRAEEWMEKAFPKANASDDDIHLACRGAIAIFRGYQRALMARGVISLPTRRG